LYRPRVLALLKSAPLLQELELEFDMPSSDAISIYFLETLTLPNLRVVSFDCTCFPSPRVLRQFFQKYKRTLTGVSLDRVALEIGSWEQVVIRMREYLRLSTVSIMSLYEGG
jgi:hypothetical protein